MTPVGFDPAAVAPEPSKDTAKAAGAAADFEALLIGQMLQSIREQGSGWLGGGDDDASATAFGLGEQYLATAIAKGGGLGLARIIQNGLAQTQAGTDAAAFPAQNRDRAAGMPGQSPPNLTR